MESEYLKVSKMKATGVFLFIAALSVAAVSSAPKNAIIKPAPVEPITVGEAMLAMINSYKRIMPCGAPEMGIPPLAPFRKDLITLDINEEMLSLTGQITNFVVAGMDKYLMIDFSTKGNRTTFDAVYEDIEILGEFDTHLFENLAGFKYYVSPKGLLNIHFKDMRISGGMTIGKNLLGGMVFSDIDYYVDMGDVVSEVLESQWSTVVNQFFNKYVRDTTLLLFEENREAISKAISGYVTPLLNDLTFTTSQRKFIKELQEITAAYDAVQCDL